MSGAIDVAFAGRLGGFTGREAPSLEFFCERHAAHKIADDIGHIVDKAHFMYGDDVRMVQLGSRPGLAEENGNLGRVELGVSWDFYRDVALKLRVAGTPYGSEAATSKLLDELEVMDGGAD